MRLVAVGALMVLAAPAWAVPVTYNFTGTVTQVGPNVLRPIAVNDVIPISITIDTSYPASQPSPGQYYSSAVYDPSTMLYQIVQSARFGGEQANGLIQSIRVSSNSIDFRTANTQVSSGFTLSFGGQSNVFSMLDLPLALDPGLFTTGSFTVTEAFSPTTYGYSGVINGLAVNSVPEPASLVALSAGIIGVGAARRRRAPPASKRL